ncbi:two-component system sensor histidine kinase MtrB [Prauserella shujinwangii]|uniref:Sensor histidine kinase MtrB n=1 Tax=Prauserella shujinwangii TaxID=1453103 RepID=A0A2T0LY53_9PSEU|nr:MtrAB system histidine kinase MtrB [Prauserella shujinwangii]PRX49053.1 two-component system sensor histidine kinase MtrB [Prauserella shujinwangii]
MNERLNTIGRSAARLATRAATFGRRRMTAFGELWRRSLQFRVTVSTLALSSAVVFVLGMVLQSQITERLMETKRKAAQAQLQVVVQTAESQLVGDTGQEEGLRNRLNNALKKITSSSVATQDTSSSAAGAFEPVLAAGDPDRSPSDTIYAGPYEKVPSGLRNFVENNQQAWQIHTVGTGADRTTYLEVGAPVTTTSRPLQLYLLFPLTAEQNTVATVQNTLLVGGLVLLLLLAGITNMVTRQVVRPVRRAAAVAERFADGELDRRLDVVGEDDLAKLAVSYNEMAASIERQMRELEEFGQLQRRFTSDVSHELRTPLTTVRMAADVLHASREQFPAGLARSTELLVDELDRFETLLRDLLEISRLDAGVEELSPEHVDVRPIAERAVEQVSVIAGNVGSSIELELPEDAVMAEIDARRVERILRNLLANAVDHSEGKPVCLRVGANESAVALTVRDYGVGLRPGEAELVFNRFWRADPSRNRRTGGTGLGLAISHEDARLHGGLLEAWGEPDRGACFRLTLPRQVGEEIGESPLGLPPDEPGEPGEPDGSDEPDGVPAGPGSAIEGEVEAPVEQAPPGLPAPDREHEEVR